MGVGWIDRIYNNTDQAWSLKSIDSSHNGAISGGGGNFALDDGQMHSLVPRTFYRADWCGIPWYYQGKHYKAFTDSNGQKSIAFYQSQVGGTNWIIFEEEDTGRQIGRTQVDKSVDYHCVMRFEPTGVFLDVVNDDGSTRDVQHQIWDVTKGWVDAFMTELAKKLADAVIGLAAARTVPTDARHGHSGPNDRYSGSHAHGGGGSRS